MMNHKRKLLRHPIHKYKKYRKDTLYILAIAFCLIFSFYTRLSIPKIVIFDLKGTYKTYLKQAAQRHLAAAQMEQSGKHFAAALSYSLESYQKSHPNHTLFVKPAVLSGAKDVTPEIQQLIAKRMQKSEKSE